MTVTGAPLPFSGATVTTAVWRTSTRSGSIDIVTVGATFIPVEHWALWPVLVSTVTVWVKASAPSWAISRVYGDASGRPSSRTRDTSAPWPAFGATVNVDDSPRSTSAGAAVTLQLGQPTAIVLLTESSSRSPRDDIAEQVAVTV